MQLIARIAQAPRVAVEFSIDFLSQHIWKALAALGFGVAGIVVAFIWIKLAEIITRARSSRRYKHDRITNHVFQTTRKSSQSVIRVVAISLAILSVIVGVWVGCNALGVSFWTVTLGTGILAWVLASAFSVSLKNVAAFLMIAMTDKLEEDWIITVSGVTGRVVGIHVLWVELEVRKQMFDKQTKMTRNIIEVTHVPTYLLLESIVKRVVTWDTN